MFLILLVCNLYDKTRKIKFLEDIIEPARIAVLRFHFSDVRRSIIEETLPKVAKLLSIDYRVDKQLWVAYIGKYNRQGVFVPNGSEIWFGGIDEGRGLDRVLGKEYLWIWFNEISEISYNSYWTTLTRLAQQTGFKNKHLAYYENLLEYFKDDIGYLGKDADGNMMFDGVLSEISNRVICDENPPDKLHWSYKVFFQGIDPEKKTVIKNFEDHGTIKMNPSDNRGNINPEYERDLESAPDAIRKRFLDGEFGEIVIGSLFNERNINQYRVISHPELRQVVVAVDPSTTSKEESDETGIVVSGRGMDGRGYALEDATGIYTPAEWANKVHDLCVRWDTIYVTAEDNQGGEMVEDVITVRYPELKVKLVHAKEGKITRAEPVSVKYDHGEISHVGVLVDLEFEMTTYTGKKREKSPNRLDALVHGMRFLFPEGMSDEKDIFGYDKILYYEMGENFDDKRAFSIIKISDSKCYNFTLLSVILKNGRCFVTNVMFNKKLPIDNLPEVIYLLTNNKTDLVIVECDKSYSDFTYKLMENVSFGVQGAKMPSDSANRILIESQNIKDNFIFPKDENMSMEAKNFITQLNVYTNLSEPDEIFAADACACLSQFIKIFAEEYSDVK